MCILPLQSPEANVPFSVGHQSRPYPSVRCPLKVNNGFTPPSESLDSSSESISFMPCKFDIFITRRLFTCALAAWVPATSTPVGNFKS
ncbi:hypothetical protein V1477_010673 [Vespula maculifrons]|uniref:Uncharacterized protein n=1 Tax=Vespula maculifrons TaxID=7453 RepID=A0ABD2C2L6_VESMC